MHPTGPTLRHFQKALILTLQPVDLNLLTTPTSIFPLVGFFDLLTFFPSRSYVPRPGHRGASYHRRDNAPLLFPLFVSHYVAGLRSYCESTNLKSWLLHRHASDIPYPCLSILSGTSRTILSPFAVVMGRSRNFARLLASITQPDPTSSQVDHISTTRCGKRWLPMPTASQGSSVVGCGWNDHG